MYQDKKSNLQDLLQKDKSVSIQMKNLQYLATETYKVKTGLSPEIMKEVCIFQENENYDLKSGTHLTNRNMHAVHFGTLTITNLGPKLWKLAPDEIKMLQHYQFLNLGQKHGPLTTTLGDSLKLLLKILVLLKSVQISNGIHNSYLRYMTIFTQKLAARTKELSWLITVITPSSDSPRQHQKNFLMRSSVVVAVTFVQFAVGGITLVFYNCLLIYDNQTKIL